ncbi:acetyltransferase [Gluconobacter thailandicus F149-1 = NBRC 100600]|uniref:GCN5-like N-acetyltransferase n=1 Tax=Gluconobacter thailandicus NBRC 3257 TaxID=1381097 RepID=A0ABQ0IVE6_GLUTH|nr:GNAT family N-acetyltransferase [Gluconobacter thailandicus]KXV52020.1 histone acetyltransferase [Gluconobacter thailandicus]GAC86618.1 GCN5-like N-acetyltransferase [Gluconobacter thailandicus NBRC 3255]GAD26179.1 GCN5-like N-acetyltransferase [Gluconobacter thailandicus NBRC 3257]GAN92279.1 acetyltransferase [Gluconobacter thailandicus F149-1 = NBRC 100600]GBR58813.1 N-acetyltransferase GCN5 [Gluconobacter thailandicus F149-1 = NBRC 100600]
MSPIFTIHPADFSNPQTRDLLALHLAGMHDNTPAGHVFALDLSGLMAPEIEVWTVHQLDRIAGIGALKRLNDQEGELKSMRTHPDFLRQGVASALLDHLIHRARSVGMKTLSLETGRGASFEPALALYQTRGFQPGEAFGDYQASEFSHFFHLTL